MGRRGMSPTRARRKRLEMGLKETKLQKLRVKRGFSQSELSVISGVGIRTLQSYERLGGTDRARLDTLCSLCIALDCKIEDIIESENLIKTFRLAK